VTEHDALLAAVCAEPDEDTPRLAYADFLEENGEPDRAAFVRAQVELARLEPWEPFAVECRWRRPDWVTGEPFRPTLPRLVGPSVEWHPMAFRRGLGWYVNVRSLIAWEQLGPDVLSRAPVGEMQLWSAATLDDWYRFADSAVVSRLRRVHFANNPIEPLRALRQQPRACGLTDVFFHRASGAGMPLVVEELLDAPLGRVLRGLHFHIGYESLEDLIDALNGGAPGLERLTLGTMGLTAYHAEVLMGGPAVTGLRQLDLRNNPLGSRGVGQVLDRLPAGLRSLGLAGTGATGYGLEALADCGRTAGLRHLDLSHNPFTPRSARTLARSPYLTGLRALGLNGCRIGERELYHFVRGKFWPGLVELDLRNNPVPPAGLAHLLAAPVPENLVALVLSADRVSREMQAELRRKYGERVVFAAA
jgi:uncharacterized protein (TIGR02996 family)